MRAIHLFAGAGGSLLLGDLLGWTHLAAAECDPWCRAVLALRWPQLEIHGRVEDENCRWDRYTGRCDIVAAGWPCITVSTAGKRLGMDDPRDCWPQLADALGELRPRLAFLECSAAALTANRGGYWARCLADLARVGMHARWIVLRASDAGAPHGRRRLWCLCWRVVADADSLGGARGTGLREGQSGAERSGPASRLADAHGSRLARSRADARQSDTGADRRDDAGRSGARVADSHGRRLQGERGAGLLDREREARRDDADGCGSEGVADPTAQTYGSNQGGSAVRVGPVRPSLEAAARDWPTPTSADAIRGPFTSEKKRTKNGRGAQLPDAVRWPTPTVSDATCGHCAPEKAPLGREGAAGLQEITPGMLSAEWVAALMGWPIGLTDLTK